MVPQMSFKGLPSNSTKQVSFYYLFYYWTSLLRRHSHYLTLGHMKIPFKQLKKKSLAGSGLIEPVTVRQSRQKVGWESVREWEFSFCPVSCVTIMIPNYPLSKNHKLIEVREKGCGFVRNSSYNCLKESLSKAYTWNCGGSLSA